MKTLDRNKLGDLIAKLRRSRDLSLDGMGELLHVSGRTIRRWEKGEMLPTMEDVISISNEFNISLEEIYEGEINLEREVNRKLSHVDSSIETIGLKITSTEEAIKSINDGVSELKNQISKTVEQQEEKTKDVIWIKLLTVHLACTSVAFICSVMSRMRFITAFLFSIAYIICVTWMLIKQRNNTQSLRLFFVYSVILLVNMLLNYVLFADVTTGIISNTELMLVNGAMYGLRIFDFDNMKLILVECVITYCFWIVYSEYHLIRKNK